MKEAFRKGYEFPLQMYGEITSKVFTRDGSMAFDFAIRVLYENGVIIDRDVRLLIVKKLNGDESLDVSFVGLEYSPDDSTIYQNGCEFIVVRGWGHLTGAGGLKLPIHEAATIQDAFGRWIVAKLSPPNAEL